MTFNRKTWREGNRDQADPNWPSAVVAGASQTGVLGVRSLSRRGVRTLCVDSNSKLAGFRSAYGPARLCPDPDEDEEGWCQFMLELARTLEKRSALIASSDRYVTAIAKHAELLEEHYIFPENIAIHASLADKPMQYALAHEHGLPMPHTRCVTSEEELIEFAGNTEYPCLLKPRHFREWERVSGDHPLFHKKVVIAGASQTLMEYYRLAAAINPVVIAQEIIQGADTAKRVYLSCYSRGGERIGHAMFQELRCDPIGFGPASVSTPVVDEETDEICDRFLSRLGYKGICEIEMKRDLRDGRVKLIEVNPRLSGGGDAAPYAGVDLCWLHYLDLVGEKVAPVGPRKREFRHIVLRADARAIPAYRRAGLVSWRDVFRSYRPPLAFFDIDRRDWRYSAETLLIAARSLVTGTFASPATRGK